MNEQDAARNSTEDHRRQLEKALAAAQDETEHFAITLTDAITDWQSEADDRVNLGAAELVDLLRRILHSIEGSVTDLPTWCEHCGVLLHREGVLLHSELTSCTRCLEIADDEA